MSELDLLISDSAQIPDALFKQVANECVPRLRRVLADLGFDPGEVSPSLGMTATIDVDGVPARVRVEVILDPDDSEAANG